MRTILLAIAVVIALGANLQSVEKEDAIPRLKAELDSANREYAKVREAHKKVPKTVLNATLLRSLLKYRLVQARLKAAEAQADIDRIESELAALKLSDAERTIEP